jgi:hypothetical protein
MSTRRIAAPPLPSVLPDRTTPRLPVEEIPVVCPQCHGDCLVRMPGDDPVIDRTCPFCGGAGTVSASYAELWRAGLRCF